MRSILASFGVAAIAAGALALTCPPDADSANAAVKGGDTSSCSSEKTTVAATAVKDGSSCSSAAKTTVAATAVKDGSSCSSAAKTTVAATAPKDGSSCSSAAKTTVAATAPKDDSGCCSADKAAVSATAPQDAPSCHSPEAKNADIAAAVAGPQMPAGFPVMTIIVGDQVTNCPTEAAKLAKTTDAQPVFLVRGMHYDSPADAGEIYARVLESYLIDITTPQLSVNGKSQECPITAAKISEECGKPANYLVATREFHSPAQAKQVAARAIEAANAVAMKITVGDTDCQSCEKTAEVVAAKTGETPVYTIGEASVECPIQAKVMLTIAKIQAAINAAAEVQQEVASAQ